MAETLEKRIVPLIKSAIFGGIVEVDLTGKGLVCGTETGGGGGGGCTTVFAVGC